MTRARFPALALLCLAAAALVWQLLAWPQAGEAPLRLFVVRAEGRAVVHLVLPNCPHGICHGSTARMYYTEHLAWLSTVGSRAPDRHSNAWTNALAVGYRVSGAPRDLPDILAGLLRVLDPIDLPPGFAEEEREIVVREYELVADGLRPQRLCIARALSVQPKLIIADEPVAALDVSIARQITDLMQELQQRLGVSFLFISHDLAVVERLCHRIAVMRAGRIVETGPTDAIIGNPREDYTKALIAAVPGRIAPAVGAMPERQSLAG